MRATSQEASLDPRFIGIPWKEGGCSFDGCDCYGLVRLWYMATKGLDIGFHMNGIEGYMKTTNLQWTEVEKGNEREGDVIVCEENGGLHCMLVIRKGSALHIRRGKSSVIERYEWERWKPKAWIYRLVSM